MTAWYPNLAIQCKIFITLFQHLGACTDKHMTSANHRVSYHLNKVATQRDAESRSLRGWLVVLICLSRHINKITYRSYITDDMLKRLLCLSQLVLGGSLGAYTDNGRSLQPAAASKKASIGACSPIDAQRLLAAR